MARPRKEPPEARRARLNLRFTAGERAQLAAAAGAAGVGLADYARRCVLDQTGQASGPSVEAVRRIDPAAIAALTRVGANLNQVARRIHSGDVIQPGEVPEVLADIARHLDRIEALVFAAIDP